MRLFKGGVLLAALLLFAVTTASAQSMEEKRDKKLAEGWVSKNPWITDYDDALAKSKETGKPIFAYFTRSYSP